MKQPNWITARCDNSGPNCPQVAADGDDILVRDSERPGQVVTFSREGWSALREQIKAGKFDQL